MPSAPIESRRRRQGSTGTGAGRAARQAPPAKKHRARRAPPAAVASSVTGTASCQACAMRAACDAAGPAHGVVRRSLRAGERLHARDDESTCLYAVRSGAFLVQQPARSAPRIVDFRLPGEAIGVDGLETGRHRLDAVALVDAQVCALPLAHIRGRRSLDPHARDAVDRLLGHEITRAHDLIAILGIHGAERRVARFLIDLLSRQRCVDGFKPVMTLPMSRSQIGSYLGMTIETTSRSFSAMQASGVLRVDLREIEVTNVAALAALAG